jgi:hypothetical protein
MTRKSPSKSHRTQADRLAAMDPVRLRNPSLKETGHRHHFDGYSGPLPADLPAHDDQGGSHQRRAAV